MIALFFIAGSVIAALPFELLVLEAAGLDLRRKLRVIGFLALPKALFWTAIGSGTISKMLGPGGGGGFLLLIGLTQPAVAVFALGRERVKASRIALTAGLLIVVWLGLWTAFGWYLLASMGPKFGN